MKFLMKNNGTSEFASIQELESLQAASDKYDMDKPGVYCRSWTYEHDEWIRYFEDLLKKVQDGKIDSIDVSKLLLYIKRFLVYYKDVSGDTLITIFYFGETQRPVSTQTAEENNPNVMDGAKLNWLLTKIIGKPHCTMKVAQCTSSNDLKLIECMILVVSGGCVVAHNKIVPVCDRKLLLDGSGVNDMNGGYAPWWLQVKNSNLGMDKI
jgi:hypothetical protein